MKGWTLVYEGFEPGHEGLREALCTLGNGYIATRGAAEESRADGVHYPGTYLAGGYDRLASRIEGRTIENEDLVNWPNWLGLSLRPEGGEWLDLARLEVLDYRQELDLKRGLLTRRLEVRDAGGRRTRIESRRLVSMADPHLAAIEWTVTPVDWSGRAEVRSSLDGRVTNSGVARYRDLRGDHLVALGTEAVGEDGMLLAVETRQSKIRMAQAARTRVFAGGGELEVERRRESADDLVLQDLVLELEREKPVAFEKTVAIHTSRDHAISECCLAARERIAGAPRFHQALRAHAGAWSRLWRRCGVEVEVEGDEQERTGLVLRLHVFHLLQTVSLNTIDRDVGVPARGLHGEAYRGHVFWDELFILPFLDLRLPQLTRELLLYRYRRLERARRAASEEGYRGAMFPWQSGSDGREESQVVHLNPRSGRWIPDHTHLQRHIGAAVAYNVWRYYQATGDVEFLAFCGAEMMLEIARFWASIAERAPDGRYDIRGVVGPDEYHTAYPGREEPGIDNNAYTNVMAAWCLWRAVEALDALNEERRAELREQLELDDGELARFDEVGRRLRLVFHGDGILSQFEGYADLEELDWEGYRRRYGDIHRLDRILEAEGDDPNRYRASKQADVLMLFYLFSSAELGEVLGRLGYPFDHDAIPRIVDHYLERTSHGSTLSAVVHAWVLARSRREGSWDCFQKALESDVADVQGGTTPEGIHLGAMAGTVDLAQRCFTGIDLRGDVLWLEPCLPEEMTSLDLRLRYRGQWIHLSVERERLRVEFVRGHAEQVLVGFGGAVHRFGPGEVQEFALARSEAPPRVADRRPPC